MKKAIILIILGLFLVTMGIVNADVWVDGYTRSDGTYVRGHWRSSPNQNKWDNYGPSQNDSELTNPRSRDYDGDGVPNYLDSDDDNDGLSDDYDGSQYGR